MRAGGDEPMADALPPWRGTEGRIKGEFSEMGALPFCVMEGILCLSIEKM